MTSPDPFRAIAHAIHANFTSPNVSDSNGEAANVVDALNECARGLFAIAQAIRDHTIQKP